MTLSTDDSEEYFTCPTLHYDVSPKIMSYPPVFLPGTPESGALPSCPFKRGATGTEVPFQTSIVGNFMVGQD